MSKTRKILSFAPAAIVFFISILTVAQVNAQVEDIGDQAEGILVKEFLITGNSVIDTQALQSAIAEFKNSELALDDMNQVAELITLAYQEKGYILARAFIPEQEIKDGILQISILEGNVGEVKVTGNTYYSDRVVKRYFQQQIKKGVIRESFLERGYLLTNDVPKLETEIIMGKGEVPGTADVVLKTSDKIGVRWGVDYNNFGSKFTSRSRFGTTFEVTDPWWGSTFSLRAVTGDDSDDSSLIAPFYKIPVNSYGTQVGVHYLKANYTVGKEFADLDIDGDTEIFGGSISHPLIRARDKNALLTLGLDHKNVEQELLDQDQSKDELNAVYLSFGFDSIDRYLGKTIFSLQANAGDLDLDNDTSTSRLDVDNHYFYLESYLTRVQKIYGYTNLVLTARGQYSPDRLVPIEAIPIGGYYMVRGHEPATYLGDSGYTFSSELLFAPPLLGDKTLFNQRVGQMLQLALWFDTGGVYNSDRLPGEKENQYLSGYGGGLRMYYKDRFTFKFDLGFPTDRKEEGRAQYLYFSGSFGFF